MASHFLPGHAVRYIYALSNLHPEHVFYVVVVRSLYYYLIAPDLRGINEELIHSSPTLRHGFLPVSENH